MTKCDPSYSAFVDEAIAVIAGVGPGLGYSLAKKFSAEYKVILLSRTQSKLDELTKEITSNGGEVLTESCCTNTRHWESRPI